MLKNHGPVVMGRDAPAMFLSYYMLQRACEIQVKTSALASPFKCRPKWWKCTSATATRC